MTPDLAEPLNDTLFTVGKPSDPQVLGFKVVSPSGFEPGTY